MPAAKRTRIQTYLEEDLVRAVRKQAREQDRPESREVGRLVRLGLQVEAQQYVLGGLAFRTTADLAAHVEAVKGIALAGEPAVDPAVCALIRLRPILEALSQAA